MYAAYSPIFASAARRVSLFDSVCDSGCDSFEDFFTAPPTNKLEPKSSIPTHAGTTYSYG